MWHFSNFSTMFLLSTMMSHAILRKQNNYTCVTVILFTLLRVYMCTFKMESQFLLHGKLHSTFNTFKMFWYIKALWQMVCEVCLQIKSFLTIATTKSKKWLMPIHMRSIFSLIISFICTICTRVLESDWLWQFIFVLTFLMFGTSFDVGKVSVIILTLEGLSQVHCIIVLLHIRLLAECFRTFLVKHS